MSALSEGTTFHKAIEDNLKNQLTFPETFYGIKARQIAIENNNKEKLILFKHKLFVLRDGLWYRME